MRHVCIGSRLDVGGSVCWLQELAFQMPFQLYTDKSLVVWGNQDYLDAGDQRHGERVLFQPRICCTCR